VLTQFIAAIAGKPDFSTVVVKVNGTPIMIGNFLNATISFLIVAFVVYFFMVAAAQHANGQVQGTRAGGAAGHQDLCRVLKRNPRRGKALCPLRSAGSIEEIRMRGSQSSSSSDR